MDEPDLTGRTALVTGSARGLGRAIAVSIAESGARLGVHYRRSAAAASETADAAAKAGSPGVATVEGDVTDPEAVDAVFDRLEAELGPVEVLVNNVGDFAPRHWAEIDPETWDRVIATNLTATYLCARRALGPMREGGWGRIVNIGYASSDRGMTAPKNFPYFAAKAGVLMFTRMLAADTSDDGITVNAVSPYVIENSEAFPADLPRGRPARFEDITNAVTFFLDPASGYVSGANLEVSGGWLPESV